MNKQLIKLRFIIDRLKLQERVILFSTVLLILLGLWLFVFYFPQKRALVVTEAAIMSEKNQTDSLISQHQLIETLSKDITAHGLMTKIKNLIADRMRIEQGIQRYEHRYIGEQKLAQLLYSLLKQRDGVSIENFSNARSLSSDTSQQPQSTNKAASTSGVSPSLPANDNTPVSEPKPPGPAVFRSQYTLTLKGDWFSIMDYLQQVEQSKWQLYWDTFDYRVKTYPEGILVLQFYTLSPPKPPEDLKSKAVK